MGTHVPCIIRRPAHTWAALGPPSILPTEHSLMHRCLISSSARALLADQQTLETAAGRARSLTSPSSGRTSVRDVSVR